MTAKNAARRAVPEERLIEATRTNSNPKSEPVFICYENRVPQFADAALDRLYGSIYSTIGMFCLDGSISSANTYVASVDGELVSVLLYRREHSVVTVLNGSIELSRVEMERFIQTIFARYKDVSVIVFNAIRHNIAGTRYPYQRYIYGEDIVADLPDSAERYFMSLGRNMRETIKRFQNRLKRNHPNFRFHTYVNEEANEEQIRELYKLQRARIANKNQVSTVTDSEIEHIILLAKTRGLVTIATIDGKVCGGMVCWRAGDNFFMRTIAHDPEYDDIKLGTLCCYYTICECIARGGKAFHFSPGRVLYKYRFLGTERQYDQVVLYRSRLHMLLNPRTAFATMVNGRIRELKLWLLDAKSSDEYRSHPLLRLFSAWRAAKASSGLVPRIAAIQAALRPVNSESSEPALRLSASREANQEIKSRRRMASPVNSTDAERRKLQSVC